MRRLMLWLVPPFVTFLVLVGAFTFLMEQYTLRTAAGQEGPKWAMPLIACSLPAMAGGVLYSWRREKINRRFLRLLAETDSMHFGCLYALNLAGCLSILTLSAGLIAVGFLGRPGSPAPRWLAVLCLSGAIGFVVSMIGLGVILPKRRP